jgi:uncharacterized cupredoxin-like copper-binding protein
MKSYFLSFLILIVFSCGSYQSKSSNKQNNNDCSAEVQAYAQNQYTLYGQMTGKPSRGQSGNYYTVRFQKPNELSRDHTINSSFTIEVDENCKVISSKQNNTRFKM